MDRLKREVTLTRRSWLKWMEIVVGLGPATVIGTPGLGFLLPFTLVVVVLTLLAPSPTWAAKLKGFREILPVTVFAVVSAAGLGALWLVILLGVEQVRRRIRLLWFARVAIVAGIMEVAFIAFSQSIWGPPHDWHIVFRAWVLFGPVVVGCHFLYLLIRPERYRQGSNLRSSDR